RRGSGDWCSAQGRRWYRTPSASDSGSCDNRVVKMNRHIPISGPVPANINIAPDLLDLNIANVTEPEILTTEDEPIIDPSFEDAVIIPATPGNGIHADARLDTVPAVALELIGP